MKSRTLMLNFPSGRRKRVVESRHDLARRLAMAPTGEWVRLNPDEVDAALSLEKWGMLSRDTRDAMYVQWSFLHERPVFKEQRYSVLAGGRLVHRLSFEQRTLLFVTIQAKGKPHSVMMKDGVLDRRRLQRMIRALEKRGVITVECNPDAWAISLVRHNAASV